MRCIDAIQHGSAAIQGKWTQHESSCGGFKHRVWQLDDWQKHQNQRGFVHKHSNEMYFHAP